MQRKFYIQLAHAQQLKVEELDQAIANDFYGKRGYLANNKVYGELVQVIQKQ